MTISKRQLSQADKIVGEFLNNAARINQAAHDFAAAVSVSFGEAYAISAGVRAAAASFFGRARDSHKRKQW